MLAEQNNSVADLKKANVSSSLLLRNEITKREVELCREYEQLQAACRQRRFLKKASIRNLELVTHALSLISMLDYFFKHLCTLSLILPHPHQKHQEAMMKMSRHYEHKLRGKKMTDLQQEMNRSDLYQVSDHVITEVTTNCTFLGQLFLPSFFLSSLSSTPIIFCSVPKAFPEVF